VFVHGVISFMTYPPDRTETLEVEAVTISVIVDTTREVVVIRGITVVIVVCIPVTQTTVADLLLGVE